MLSFGSEVGPVAATCKHDGKSFGLHTYAGNFVTSWATVSFPRGAVLQRVTYIWGFHGGDYKYCEFLESDAV
jgi:hypothetical protein